MNPTFVRIECVKLAIETGCATPEILDLAKAIYKFVMEIEEGTGR